MQCRVGILYNVNNGQRGRNVLISKNRRKKVITLLFLETTYTYCVFWYNMLQYGVNCFLNENSLISVETWICHVYNEWATKSPQIQSPRFLKSFQTLFTWGLYLVRHHTPEEQNHKSRKYLWCYKFLIRMKSNMEEFPSLFQILSLVQNLPSQTIFP